MGTCLEMSALGFTYAAKILSKQAELFHIENGNHVFLVLGREPGSRPAEYQHWGEAAVVCDVWRGESYPASELENRLQNFERQTPDLKTVLKPFDPKKQSLKQLA